MSYLCCPQCRLDCFVVVRGAREARCAACGAALPHDGRDGTFERAVRDRLHAVATPARSHADETADARLRYARRGGN
jgi:hypothetical protein